MQRLGVIARADNGGLGNLLWEMCRHLEPDRVLIMDLGEFGRSDVHLDRFDGLDTRVVHGLGIPPDDRAWLLDGCDVLYSAETWYEDDVAVEAAEAGVRTVLHIMPELFTPNRIADELWIPTTYRRGFVPEARLVPVPVALDRFDYKPRTPAHHFVSLWAPAMLDRNGTDVAFSALELISDEILFTVIGAQQNVEMPTASPVTLDCTPRPYPDNYFDVWPDDADVLVLPRRYAGLSMPVQEAAARGMPAIMTGCEPQRDWPGVVTIPIRGRRQIRMAGGLVDVWDPDPTAVAREIDRLASTPAHAEQMSAAARRWAEGLSWDVWAPRYRDLLGLT